MRHVEFWDQNYCYKAPIMAQSWFDVVWGNLPVFNRQSHWGALLFVEKLADLASQSSISDDFWALHSAFITHCNLLFKLKRVKHWFEPWHIRPIFTCLSCWYCLICHIKSAVTFAVLARQKKNSKFSMVYFLVILMCLNSSLLYMDPLKVN